MHHAPTSSSTPSISVGLPVYNGERFLRQALESILTQTFYDIEIIISDNASTDGTESICKEFVARDPRINYIRQPVNIGAMRNWNFVANQARGEYFKWMSASDYCAPDMLARCFEAMNDDSNIVLCYGQTCLVDEDTGKLTEYYGNIEIMEDRPHERFAKLRNSLKLNNAYCGVIRTDALRLTKLNRLYSEGDIVLMAELALLGRFRLLPKILSYRRMGCETSSNKLNLSDLAIFLDPQNTYDINLRSFYMHRGILSVILRTPISVPEKLKTFALAFRHIIWAREALASELHLALKRSLTNLR